MRPDWTPEMEILVRRAIRTRQRAVRERALEDLWKLTGGTIPRRRPRGDPLNMMRALLIADTYLRPRR